MTRSTVACLLGLGLLAGYEAYALFVREWGLASNIPPANERGLSREAAGERAVGQTFTMHADGLYAVEVYPKRSRRPPAGPLVITLEQASPAGWIPIVRTQRAAADVALDGPPLRLEVPRLDASASHMFLLTLALPEAAEGEGMLFESSGPNYREGQAYWFHRPSWGDLSFQTYAERTTIARTLDARRRQWPAPFNLREVWFAILIAVNAALAALVYDLIVAKESATRPPGAVSQRPNGSAAATAVHPRV